MNSLQHHHNSSLPKIPSFLQISLPPPRLPPPNPPTPKKIPPSSKPPSPHLPNLLKIQPFLKSLTFMPLLSLPLPAFAAQTEQTSDKINIESILVAIDDFNNRNPFFVGAIAFVWLVVIPLTEQYLKKCKFISAIDAFRKLRDVPAAQLLDIRKKQSVLYMSSPKLKIFDKSVVQLEFVEGEEEGFLAEVVKRFGEPENTVICVLDNFDGNSLKVAELLFENGFKEAYAIKGGLRGNDGWQAIQETLLPPSVHVYPRKKKRKLSEENRQIDQQNNGYAHAPASSENHEGNDNLEKGYAKPTETASEAKVDNGKPLSPYPKYPDMKPPSSPIPSKPQS